MKMQKKLRQRWRQPNPSLCWIRKDHQRREYSTVWEGVVVNRGDARLTTSLHYANSSTETFRWLLQKEKSEDLQVIMQGWDMESCPHEVAVSHCERKDSWISVGQSCKCSHSQQPSTCSHVPLKDPHHPMCPPCTNSSPSQDPPGSHL